MRDDVVGARFPSTAPLEGLAGPVGGRTWLGLPLAVRQERAFLEANIRFTDDEPPDDLNRVLVRDDVALTGDAVTAFVAAAEGRDACWSATGRAADFSKEIALGDSGPWLVHLAAGGAISEERIRSAEPVEVDLGERMLTIPLSEAHHGVAAVELPVTDRLVLPTRHWLQLLWANLLGMGPFLWRSLVGRNIVEVAGRVSWAAIRAGSVKPRRIGAQLGRRGSGCRIHPSAVIEGCWLGDDVEIGAGAVVRGSILADGTSVEDLAFVEFSVLASGARVQRQAMVKFSVLGAASAAGGLMQLGVLDRDAALKRTGVLMDMALGQRVEVMVDGKLRAAPLGLAGVCVGEGSTVAAGVQIAPGRCVPAGMQIVPGGHSTVSVIPEGLEGLVVVRDGTVVPR